MKLIKIAEPDNFIVVEGDDFHNNNLAPKDFAYHWKLKEIVQVHFKIVESGLKRLRGMSYFKQFVSV